MPPTLIDPSDVSSVTPIVQGPDMLTEISMKNGVVLYVTETSDEVSEAIDESKNRKASPKV